MGFKIQNKSFKKTKSGTENSAAFGLIKHTNKLKAISGLSISA